MFQLIAYFWSFAVSNRVPRNVPCRARLLSRESSATIDVSSHPGYGERDVRKYETNILCVVCTQQTNHCQLAECSWQNTGSKMDVDDCEPVAWNRSEFVEPGGKSGGFFHFFPTPFRSRPKRGSRSAPWTVSRENFGWPHAEMAEG